MSAVAHGVRVLSYRPGSSTDPVGVSACEASSIAFESVEPFRLVRPYRGGVTLLGEWWLATTNRHVTFESFCERDYLIEFDFDPEIVGVAAQPFAVWLTGSAGTVGEHVPDLFLRTAP